MGYRLRVPTSADADDLGRVHVRAWQAAYRGGLVPADYLAGLSEADRAATWRHRLEGPPATNAARFVAYAEDGAVVGFVLVGPDLDDTGGRTGQLQSLTVEPSHWGQGAGCDLLATGVATLTDLGFDRAIVWVHHGNARARRFYELHSWSHDGLDRRADVGGVEVKETRYSRPLV